MPIDPATLISFVLTAGAIVLSPGPDTLLILRYTLRSGPRVGLATVAGVQAGLIAHTLLAIFGVSVIIASSPVLYKTLALSGALYLGWLGVQGFRAGGGFALDASGPAVSSRRALRDAFICNILNPKVIVLFLALFPNFVTPARGDTTVQLAFLAFVLVIINIVWQAPMAWLGGAIGRWMATPRAQRLVGGATGVILLIFAALMVYDHLLS